MSVFFLRLFALAGRIGAPADGRTSPLTALMRVVTGPEARLAVTGLWVRLLSFAFAVLAIVLFPLARPQQFSVLTSPNPIWDSFARFDSGWYFGIARYGYEYVEGGRSNFAFFPVYPMLMRYVGLALGGGRRNLYLAGIIVSWVAFLVACILLYRLAREYVSEAQARRAVILAMTFPFAFFYGVVYTESVFLMLSVGAFLAFRTGHGLLGGLAGAALTATRVNGIVAWPAMAVVAWERTREHPRERAEALLGVLLVPMGLAAYSAFTYSLSGSPLEWMRSIERWDYHPGGLPWMALVNLIVPLVSGPYEFLSTNPQAPYDLLNGLAVMLALALLPRIRRTLGWGYVLLVVANLWLPLSSGVFEGLGRYCAVLFPLFIALSTIESPQKQQLLFVSFGALYMLCSTLFTNLHPIF